MEIIVRQRVLEEGKHWSTLALGKSGVKGDNQAEPSPSDSNSNPYMTTYWPQGGRGVGVTLGLDEVKKKELDDKIPRIQAVFKYSR